MRGTSLDTHFTNAQIMEIIMLRIMPVRVVDPNATVCRTSSVGCAFCKWWIASGKIKKNDVARRAPDAKHWAMSLAKRMQFLF